MSSIPEKDARSKICPLLKTHDDKMKFCVGSQCMMWRFVHPGDSKPEAPGYCGLAGRPAGAA